MRRAGFVLWPAYAALTLVSQALHWIIYGEWAPLCARAAWIERGIWRGWCRVFDVLLWLREPDHCAACLRRHLRRGVKRGRGLP